MKYSDLAEIAAGLAANPPSFAVTPERKKVLLKLDGILKEANCQRTGELGQYYRERADAAIKEIAAYRGSVPRLWKFYSSGLVFKDADRTIGFDIADCIPPHGRAAVGLSPEQIEALADVLDEHYITHAHSDHLDPRLCDALAARRKLIVMPQEAISRWIVPSAVPAEKLSVSHVKTHLSYQGTDEIKGMDCAMYLFILSNGKRLFMRGDIYHRDGFNSCLEKIRSWGETIDYTFTSPYFTSGEAPFPRLEKEFDCRFIPIHEWEFAHRKQDTYGTATQCFEELHETLASAYARGKAQFLTWGESIDLD